MTKNVLWIMADQLRWDYLGCTGHPHIKTPNIDALAARGVLFNRAYVNAPVCGASRMSYYTGRYCRSHGCTWNFFPLKIGEKTLGDHLRPLGVQPVLVGKTHMIPDLQGMEWLGIDPASDVGVRHAECGFDAFDRDDGLHTVSHDLDRPYKQYLKDQGFDTDNPWHDWANSGATDDGALLSGWLIQNNTAAARIPEEHSETAYMTNKAIEFMDQAQGPWLCHLSYIKPHWPYIVPAPYHDMYPPETWLPVVRSEAERQNAHPVFDAYINSRICRAFAQDKVREAMLGAYMGLITQIDDHIGRLMAWMEDKGLLDNTMVVMSSDHGDYLGDHWMGEKDLFHDPSVRVPLIIADPAPQADATRGTVSDALVEGIDLAPTFLQYFGGAGLPHILEGHDLSPILHGTARDVRDFAISEYDYGTREAGLALGIDQKDGRLIMCCDKRWKYWHCEGFRPMLFDLEMDPQELVDLGDSPHHQDIRDRMAGHIFEWARRHHMRTTRSAEELMAVAGAEPPGIIIGVYDEDDYAETFGHPFQDRPV